MSQAASELGQIVLNRDAFRRSVVVRALVVEARDVDKVLRMLRRGVGKARKEEAGLMLTRPHVKPIIADKESGGRKWVLLSERVKSAAELPEEIQAMIANASSSGEADAAVGTTASAFADAGKSAEPIPRLAPFQIDLTYENFTIEEVLREFIPKELEIPSAYEQIGTIAHLNLRPEYSPWKRIIGEVLVDKATTTIRTVVNKIGSVETEFRTFPMEVLAGDDSEQAFSVEVKEHGFVYEFDFRYVYWNSRLSTEHQRLVNTYFKKGQTIVDVMAGVGPFAIPAAHKGCIVYANDLNPKSFESLVRNIPKNKVSNRVIPFNLDGREFLRRAFHNPQHVPNGMNIAADHIVMNLPATAIEFLDALRGAFHPDFWKVDSSSSSGQGASAGTSEKKELPLVHCYCFSKDIEHSKQEIAERVKKAMGCEKVEIDLSLVRDVAPNKYMYCVHFRVPGGVAFNIDEADAVSERKTKATTTSEEEPESKRQRVE